MLDIGLKNTLKLSVMPNMFYEVSRIKVRREGIVFIPSQRRAPRTYRVTGAFPKSGSVDLNIETVMGEFELLSAPASHSECVERIFESRAIRVRICLALTSQGSWIDLCSLSHNLAEITIPESNISDVMVVQ